MTLLEEFKTRDAEADYDRYPDHDEVAADVGAEQVHYSILNETRWGIIEEYVYGRDGEFVRVVYESAGGDGSCPYQPDFKTVVPREKTIIVYEPIK